MEHGTLYYIQVLFLLIGYKSFNGIVKHDGHDDTGPLQSGNYPRYAGPEPWIRGRVTWHLILKRGRSSWGSGWLHICHSYTDPRDRCTQSCSLCPLYNSRPRLTNTTSEQLEILVKLLIGFDHVASPRVTLFTVSIVSMQDFEAGHSILAKEDSSVHGGRPKTSAC